MSNLVPHDQKEFYFSEAEIVEAENKTNSKSYFGSTQEEVAFISQRIHLNGYVATHPMVHTDGERFGQLTERYLKLLTNVEDAEIANNRVAEEIKELNKLRKQMEKALKDAINVKHLMMRGNWRRKYGLIKINSNITWGRRQEIIARNLNRCVETLKEVGHDGFQYTIADYEDLATKYNNLVRKGFVNDSSSMERASKNELRDELEKLHRCIMFSLRANYPDNWKAKAIEIGFLKVRN